MIPVNHYATIRSMKPTLTPERTLSEMILGLKAGIVVGPGMVILIALGLAVAGAFLYPVVGPSAWHPVLGFIESDSLARVGAILYGLVALLLTLEALKSQYGKRGQSETAERFLFGKASELWTQAPNRRISETSIPVHNHPRITIAEYPYSAIQPSLIASNGVTSVARGIQ